MFELGLMAVEIPEEFGGQGGSFFQAVLAIEAHREGGPVGRGDRRRAEHHRQQCAAALGHRRAESEAICPAWPPTPWARSRYRKPVPAPTPSRWPRAPSDEGDWFRLNGRKLWITNAAEAGIFLVFANADPGGGPSRHHLLSWSSAISPAFGSERRRTSWASARPPLAS